MAPSVPSFLSQNVGTKIVALLLALVVYAHVYTEQERETRLSVPLQLTGLADELVLVGDPPREALVTVRGKGKQLLKLRVSPPRLVVDLAGAGPGQVQRMLSPADVDLPVGADASVTAVLEPRLFQFEVDSLVTRRVPVVVRLAGELPASLLREGPPRTLPERVRLRGPSSRVDSLEAVATRALDLADIRGAGEREEELELAALPEGVEAEPERVRVRLEITALRRRALGPLPVTLSGVARDQWVRVVPESVRVTVSGPGPLVDTLRPDALAFYLDARGLTPGRHLVGVQWSLPSERLTVAGLEPADFLVEIGPPPR